MFDVGQQVVCVDDEDFTGGRWAMAPYKPQRGHIYTVRDCVQFKYYRPKVRDYVVERAVYLEELVNPQMSIRQPSDIVIHVEPPFQAFRFRPVRKTDISIFTVMLTDVPKIMEAIAKAGG